MKELPADVPKIAILRDIHSYGAIKICKVLSGQAIQIIDVPLNSPMPFKAIRMFVNHVRDKILLGIGTVLSVSVSVSDVTKLHKMGEG